MSKNTLISTLLFLPLFMVSCLQEPLQQDVVNRPDAKRVLRGVLVTPSNLPAVNTGVKIYPSGFVPWLTGTTMLAKHAGTADASFTFYADSDGVYEIPLPDTGVYNLFGVHSEMAVLIKGIRVSGEGSVTIPADTVRVPGGIVGVTRMPGENDTDQVRVTVYLPGTKWITKPHIGGAFALSALPQGTYTVIIVPELDSYNVKVIEATVLSGDVLNLDTITLEKKAENNLIFLDSSRSIVVPPDSKWHSTGCTVNMGNTIIVKASGLVTSEEYGAFEPDGGTALGGLSFLMVNQPVFALFARIGDGVPFRIGSSFLGSAQQSGELHLAVNSERYKLVVKPPAADQPKDKSEPVVDTIPVLLTGSFAIDSLVVLKR